jgi:hypothetical protein
MADGAAFHQIESRHVVAGFDVHQGALGLVALDQHHGVDAGIVEQRALDLVGHHVVRRGVERQRGQGAAFDELFEIDHPEAGDRRQEDQDLGRHHRRHDECQNPPRQAEARPSRACGPDRFGRNGDFGGHRRPSLSKSIVPA